MRSFRFVLILAAVAAIAAPTPHAQAPQPALRIVHFDPLVVRGLYFQPSELVRVAGIVNRVELGTSVRSTAGGTFLVTFRNVHAGGCSGAMYLMAMGSMGSLAILKMPPRLCPVAAP
jgi:hypothetical protein